MKLKYIAQSIAAVALLASCTDNDYMELNKGEAELEIKASSTEVTLEEANHASTAIELSWTTGTNHGTGNRISYTLEIAEAGTNFAEPYLAVVDATQEYAWSPSVEDLNSIILNDLHLSAGYPVALEARVTATVAEVEGVQESTTSFSVTPYTPVTSTLYIIGDASPNGWSADNATEMTRSDNGIFTCTCEMRAGEFKFITTRGQFLPSYNSNGNGGLVYRDSDDQPDEKFGIAEAGFYRIDVNLLTLSIKVTQTSGAITPEYSELFFVGEETGWSFRRMDADPLDAFTFKIGIHFTTGGEFKFGTVDGSWENMLKATQPNAPYTDTSMELVKGFDPDNKWCLTADQNNKPYRIWVDTRSTNMRMLMREFTPYTEMYLVGDATPNGWDLGNATPMTLSSEDPYIFTWTGSLTSGELKFSADKQSDWGGAWFMAATENAEPTGEVEPVIFLNKSDDWFINLYTELSVGDIDRKWKISTAGTYTITLDQLHDTISIVRN